LLATPLTVCLVVLGRHVDRLKFLDILLGDRPALAPEEGFYQRVLAGDPDEAALQAEQFLKGKALSEYYDEVALKGLALAQLDMNRGVLDHDRRVQIKEVVDGIIDDLSDHDDSVRPAAGEKIAESQAAAEGGDIPQTWRETAVLCVAGRGSLDEATAAMLAQLLGKHGIGARVTPSGEVSVSNLFQLDTAGIKLAFLCYLEAGGYSNARYLVRRLRRKLPHATIAIAFWRWDDTEATLQEMLTATGADLIVTSLRQAIDQALTLARPVSGAAGQPVDLGAKAAAE
jgi:hypothetical protein